jgi:hypothetical protein
MPSLRSSSVGDPQTKVGSASGENDMLEEEFSQS